MLLRSGRSYSFRENEKKIKVKKVLKKLDKSPKLNLIISSIYLFIISLLVITSFVDIIYSNHILKHTIDICNKSYFDFISRIINFINKSDIINYINNTDEIDPYFDYF